MPATVTGDVTDTTFTLDPNAALVGGTDYTARLTSAITDEGAVAFAGTSWQFTTIGTPADNTAPTVTSRTPGAGAIGVASLQTVTVEFSEAVLGVDETTFTLRRSTTGAIVPAAVFRRGTTNRWSLNPDDPLADDALVTVRLDGGAAAIRDLADNPLADDTWSFRTGAGPDAAGPRVVSRRPSPGATGVDRLTLVRVRFNEVVLGVDEATFTLRRATNGMRARATVSRVASRQWVLEPNRALRRGTSYVASLSGAGIEDVSGNALTPTSWSFRTGF